MLGKLTLLPTQVRCIVWGEIASAQHHLFRGGFEGNPAHYDLEFIIFTGGLFNFGMKENISHEKEGTNNLRRLFIISPKIVERQQSNIMKQLKFPTLVGLQRIPLKMGLFLTMQRIELKKWGRRANSEKYRRGLQPRIC